jgi:hypothetical protein
MMVATVLISISTNIPPYSLKGIYAYPETTVFPVTFLMKALLTMSIMLRKPSEMV